MTESKAAPQGVPMVTSKEILGKTGISRATLNNYIALGILPKPELKKAPGGVPRAPRMGYFPNSSLDTIKRMNALKAEGFSMNEIADIIRKENALKGAQDRARTQKAQGGNQRHGSGMGGGGLPGGMGGGLPGGMGPDGALPSSPPPGGGDAPVKQPATGDLKLTIDHITHPAYLVNNNFDVEWCNPAGLEQILGGDLSGDISECNLFSMFRRKSPVMNTQSRDDILRFHMGLAKKRLSRTAVCSDLYSDVNNGSELASDLARLYDEAETITSREMLDVDVNLAAEGEEDRWHRLYASFFREGIFFVFAPLGKDNETLLSFLSRRDIVIRDLLKSRRPYLTPLSVLVADLQDSVKICAELPPEEYFELINDIWGAMDPLLRKYYATYGKHVGDGMVYYFFPQPDCSHVYNAINCAYEMQQRMVEVSRRWKSRKNWLNNLKLNTGLEEGEEWFGTYQTPTHLEFTVLGDTINNAARLSDFARNGTVWVSKSMLGKLSPEEREKVRYGIRRQDEQGNEILVPATFSRLSGLVDLENPRYRKLKDIAALVVTEVLDIAPADGD